MSALLPLIASVHEAATTTWTATRALVRATAEGSPERRKALAIDEAAARVIEGCVRMAAEMREVGR